MIRALTLAIGAAILVPAALAQPQAQAVTVDPYDGRKPFRCKVQRVGTGTAFPDRAADPFCVRFDKTNQDLAELGVLDFLAQEPARVAAALGKCFYFQADEWRGSILAGGGLETYHWKGRYFFDLARGAGGVYVKELRLGGQGGDPRLVDLVPDPLGEFLHETGGGGLVRFEVPADPGCAARVDTRRERRAVYRRWYRRLGDG